MSNKMLNKLKQTYEENEEKVSFDLWDKLESRLDENASEETSKIETPKPSFGWFKYAVVFLIFATLGGILFLNSNRETEQKQIVKTEENQVEKNENSTEQIIETQPTENVEIISNETQVANVEVEKNNSIQTQSNPIKTQKTNNNSVKNSVKIIGKPQNILAQNPEVKKEIQQNVPHIIEIQPEQKTIAKTKKSYIKAEDLLFERELNKVAAEQKSSKSKNKLGKLEGIQLPQVKSVTVLGVTVFDTDSEE